jgi:fimbrial isopeptide formation D2 family protein/LPXTG-motif cell wall-anchored protein
MKHLNKLLNGIIAAVSAFAMALVLIPTGALAADATTYTLTLNGTVTGHTYQAYQIFSGDLNGSTLSNIKWGTGVDATKTVDNKTLIEALKADSTLSEKFANVTDAASVAEALSSAQNDDAVAKEFAQVVNKYLATTPQKEVSSTDKTTAISGLSAGYYLVKDKDNSLGTDKKDAYTRFVMEVVKDVTTNVKSDVPTVEKKVKDTNDSTGKTTGWQDSADYDINDSVPYQITGTMPSNIADYKTYSYTFTDTMSKGLTYTAKTAKVTIGTTDVTSSFKETVTKNNDGTTTVTWACTDLKAISGVTIDANTKVVVNYSAKLNDQAVLGSAGNPNTVYLTFSNNPNKGGEGNTGKTPEDKNIVFTYKTVVNKVDQYKKSLAGAAFKLEKKQSDGTYKEVKSFTADDKTTSFEFSGLDDGDYKLTETTTPAGYNTIAPVEFTISATHDVTADDPKLLTLSGDVTSGTAEFAADTRAGSLTTDVVNKKGSVLPSTGGMGTTVLYVAGAAIIVAAGLGLAKRRSAHKDAE